MAEPTIEEIDKAAEHCKKHYGEAGLDSLCGDCPLRREHCYAIFARAYLARGKEIEALRKVEEAARACRWDGPTFNLNQLGLRKALDSLDELRRG